jgi:GGDEF domain-containing protein
VFVLMVSNPELFTYHGDVPIAASLRLDLTGPAMLDLLAPLLEPPQPAPTTVADMEDRFLVVGRGLGGTALGPPDAMPQQHPHRTRELTPGRVTPPRATIALGPWERRQQSGVHAALVDRLALVESRLEQHRDGVTGLASPLALYSALRALQDSTCPTAVIVLQLWYVREADTTKRLRLDDAALRRAGAMLRVTLRQEDLACRLDGTCFALVMAGLHELTAPQPVERIRTALAVRPTTHRNLKVATAVGVGYWQPPMATTQPLEQAWQAMAAASDLLLG